MVDVHKKRDLYAWALGAPYAWCGRAEAAGSTRPQDTKGVSEMGGPHRDTKTRAIKTSCMFLEPPKIN